MEAELLHEVYIGSRDLLKLALGMQQQQRRLFAWKTEAAAQYAQLGSAGK